ncbi:rho guanine nucleotide exchange factor TIAM2 isoform X1, partial [Tachysurus ichikawai]
KVQRVCPLYQTYPEVETLAAEGYRNPYSTESGTARGSPRHMTITERLQKVIQELVDTEKSYVKVRLLTQLLIDLLMIILKCPVVERQCSWTCGSFSLEEL